MVEVEKEVSALVESISRANFWDKLMPQLCDY